MRETGENFRNTKNCRTEGKGFKILNFISENYRMSCLFNGM